MMFSKKDEQRTPYTIEKCSSCNKENKRKFKDGDYIFQETKTCDSCKGQMRIEKIYGEIVTV
jgi:hypothetical protein